MRGGRCWFAVDSKSFELLVEVVGGNSFWREVETSLLGFSLGSEASVVCWKAWKLVAGRKNVRGVAKQWQSQKHWLCVSVDGGGLKQALQ